MKNFNTKHDGGNPTLRKYRRSQVFLILFTLLFAGELKAKPLNCGDLVFSLQVINNGSGCCYRLLADNGTPDNCFMNINLTLNAGGFTNFAALPGWQYNTGGPTDYTVRPSIGFIPPGSNMIAEFCVEGAPLPTLTLLWNDLCVLEGCATEFVVDGCIDPLNASVIGVKYKECSGLPYINQTPLSGWTIQLFDADGNVLDEQITAVDGSYGFYDLPAGTFVVKETQQPGWTANQPASGQTTVDLNPSQQRIVNFGNCPPPVPSCDCPAGTQSSLVNLVQNGDFSGSGGFNTGYTLNNNPSLQSGQYWIGSNPSTINAGFAACGDHTSGSGNMMVVNGSTNPNVPIWTQTYTMAPNTTYKFEYWVASLSTASPAQLISVLQINNVLYGSNEFAPVTTCTWEKKCRVWTTNASPATITISIYNQNIATTGNDFAIDDISFRRCVPPFGTITGRVYQTCDSMAYTNQPGLGGQTVQVLDTMGNIISEQMTDTSGGYAFADLPLGWYWVKVASQPGWTPNIPASGQTTVEMEAGETVVENFGICLDCPTCPPPANFSVTPVSATEVEVSWDAASVACGESVCICKFWADAIGFVRWECFYYEILPTMDSHLFPIEPGVTNRIFAMTVCDSSMSVSTDTIVYNYPCLGGYTSCPGTLINNGSFENGTAGFPIAADQINQTTGWQSANSGNISSLGDWYSHSNGLWNGLYNDVPNQQYNYFHASCGLKYAGFDLTTCEGITTQLTLPIGINTGYNIGFWWSPKEPVTSNFTFYAILSGANCSVNTANGGTACTHQCNGDFHVPVTVTPAHQPGTWYFHSYTANAPMTVNHLTFTAKSGGPMVNNYIYLDEVCVQKVFQICDVGKPRVTQNPDQPHAFLGEADLGPGSTLLSAVWDFGDGTQDSSCCLGSIIHDFAPGMYEVCLTVTAMDTSGTTCSNSTCITVDITTQSTKCDNVAAFIYPAFGEDCCYTLNINNVEPNCFTQIDLTLSSGTFVNSQFFGNYNIVNNGNMVSLTPIPGPFLPLGQDNPVMICDPGGIDPYTVDIDFVYAGDVCHRSISYSCADNCTCLGFTNLQFTTVTTPPLPPVPVDCENATPVELPCIANDAFYNFEGSFGCTNECISSVSYQFFDQNSNQIQYGQANYDSGLDYFNLNPGFKFQPGTYELLLTGLCGTGDTCYCNVTFIVPECPCCSEDINEFNQTIADEISISQAPSNCKATLNIGTLPCQRVEWVNWGDFTVDQGPFLSGAMPMHSYTQSGTYTISYKVTEFNSVTGLICFQATISETIQIYCNCQCGIFDMEIRLGGALNQPVVCGQTVDLGPSQGFAFYPKFQCQGNYCPPTAQVDWTLTGPNTNLSGTETTTPGAVFTILPVNPGQFTTPGTYTLTMTGHCDLNQCPCVITFNVQDPCCSDQAAFLAAAAAVQTFGTLGTCTLNFQAQGLNDCMRITYDWGDNTSSGPFGDNVPAMHTYAQTGTYNVCYTIEEIDFFGNVCWTYQSCEQVYVICNDCVCGTFSEMYARPTAGAQSIELSCGQSYTFGCPNPGFSIPITGKFECQGANCASSTLINWTLTGPGPNGPYSGTIQAAPYFYLPILPYQYGTPGNYTLTLAGNCGAQPCTPCVIQFTVNCTDPCPCNPTQLQTDVNQGFANILYNNSCKGCFSPVALNDCDMVNWSVNGGPVIGMTNGNGTFCHTFSGAGSHSITMTVIRKDTNGAVCAQASITKTVILTCLTLPDCGNGIIANPRMNEGAVSGGLNSGGASSNWLGLTGDPEVIEGAQGSLDGFTIKLSGKLDSSDVLSQAEPICLKKATGSLMFRFSRIGNGECCPSLDTICCPNSLTNISFGCNLSIQLFRGDDFVLEYPTWNPIRCLKLASIELAPIDGEWVDVEVPFDISIWSAEDTCGDAPHGVFVRPVIYINNALGGNQGGDATRTSVQIDNFCMDGTLVAVNEPLRGRSLRIFPNPNSGTFTVELPEPAWPGVIFYLTDIAGRLVQEQKIEPGSAQQIIRAGELPSGLYFLQVVSEGRVFAIEKFMKQ